MTEFYQFLMGAKLPLNEAMGPGERPRGAVELDHVLRRISDMATKVGATKPDEAMGMLKAAAYIAREFNSPLFMSLFHDHPLPSGGSYDYLGRKTSPPMSGGTGI
jgi:hypothetical protein